MTIRTILLSSAALHAGLAIAMPLPAVAKDATTAEITIAQAAPPVPPLPPGAPAAPGQRGEKGKDRPAPPERAEQPGKGPDKGPGQGNDNAGSKAAAAPASPPAAPNPPARPEAPKQQAAPQAPTAPQQSQQPAQQAAPAAPAKPAAPQQQAAPQAPTAPQQSQQPAQQAAPAAPAKPEAPQQQAAPQAPAAPQQSQQPAQAQGGNTAPPASAAGTLPVPNGAPVLDSAKEQPAGGAKAPATASAPQAPSAPPPSSDAEAQTLNGGPVELRPATAAEGRRIDRAPDMRLPDNLPVVRREGGRALLKFGDQIIIENGDRSRLTGNASDVFYEDLGNGLTRETVVRANGVKVVTIRNQYGDIIQRSRIGRNGREVVLVYAPERRRGDGFYARDAGRDLPPMVLGVPIDRYIFEASPRATYEDYYDFLAQPPVERVERLYTVDEVRYSARIRDKLPRVDLDTITFEFGRSDVPDDQIGRLEGVAEAIQRLLDNNPGETFLLEGHTDAVGSDQANLILSDERAESVATALTRVFEIPPENLVTQGYGEQYLKVRTEEPERLNRRVTIRRITPLVRPVAQN